ncbi:MAG: hypothetical protein K1X89_17850 [Myxococcaceae bacterium]|nr:hypothetical protein [Myxococcaceae bacterium]
MRLPLLGATLVTLLGCGPLPGEFGSSCAKDGDCKTGACFSGFTGGYCSARCEDAACPQGTRCAALAQGNFCLQDCAIGALDCRSGYQCGDVGAGSVCLPDCASDTDCGAGARCADKKCVAGTPGANGAACLLNAGCTSGRCEVSLNGGLCTEVCAQSSQGAGSFDQGCSGASVCAAVGEVGGLCFATCTADAQCRSEYACVSGACKPKCRGSTNCPVGYSCNRSVGQCVEGSAAPRQLGAACGADGDCDSTYCLDPSLGFPKGICSDDCSTNASVCGASGVCIVPADTSAASVCLQKCQSNFDCRADYFCSAVRNSNDRVCLPRCTAVSLCVAPEVCDQYSGDCVPPGQVGTSTIERVSLGAFPLASSGDSFKNFSVTVPQDAVSFTLFMKGGVGGTSAVTRLTAPSGDLLFDLDNYQTSKVRILPVNDGDFGMLFPNSPRVPIEVGTYQVTVGNSGGVKAGEVFALLKHSTGRLTGGNLNLNFWFAGLEPLNAASAPNDPNFKAALEEFRTIYATAGIALGTVSYFDVPAGQAAAYAVIDSTDGKDSELRKLFELSAGAPNNAMNFFLVREIKGGQAGFVILGIAGGIPGIPFEQGTNASGVAVTAQDLAQDPKSVARTMAHEGGHWLGLWHLTEQDGQMFDPLSDTPECPIARDANKDQKVTKAECAGFGAEYLMFWEAGPTASQLSSNQGFVLQRSPVVSQ